MIVRVDKDLIEKLVIFAHMLWPEDSKEELKEDFYESLDLKNEQAFLYEMADVGYIGFIQLSLRHDYVEGCDSSPVAYIEGIYVEEQYRRHGIAQELVKFAESWGRERDCIELASDCELENNLSIDFHSGSGFTETNRLVCFKKDIK